MNSLIVSDEIISSRYRERSERSVHFHKSSPDIVVNAAAVKLASRKFEVQSLGAISVKIIASREEAKNKFW